MGVGLNNKKFVWWREGTRKQKSEQEERISYLFTLRQIVQPARLRVTTIDKCSPVNGRSEMETERIIRFVLFSQKLSRNFVAFCHLAQ